MFSSISSLCLESVLTCDGIVGVDPHGRRVGDGGHGGLRALLLLAVDDEEEQEEEHKQHQHYDARDDSDLVGVYWQGRAGQAVQGPHNDNTSWSRQEREYITFNDTDHMTFNDMLYHTDMMTHTIPHAKINDLNKALLNM